MSFEGGKTMILLEYSSFKIKFMLSSEAEKQLYVCLQNIQREMK